MSDLRDFTGKNRRFTGTSDIKVPEGTTGQRVNRTGALRFNSTTGLAEYYNGTIWKSIDAPPSVTGVSPSTFASDGSSTPTITISGSGFDSGGVSVTFIGNDGTEYTGGSPTFVSATSVTATVTTAMTVDNEPYDVKVTNNGSNLGSTLADALDAGSKPTFATSADTTVATTFEGAVANTDFNETSIKATDADSGQQVIHNITAGSLPPGLSLSNDGDIIGTVSGSSVQTYTFTVTASDGAHNVTRQFNITNSVAPSIEYLIVAGGGGGGGSSDNQNNYAGAGGGGAGGYRTGTVADPTAARVYTVTVGSGAGTTSYNANGASGSASSLAGTNSFTTITSAGGGGGGRENFTGNAGGSGGGGGAANGERPYNGNGGAGNTPSVSPSQGNSGGSGRGPSPSQPYGGGGGGGASQAGQSGNSPSPHGGGEGGDGTANSITGSSVTYAGGGGGGVHDNTGAEGGSGGGGRGGQHNGPQNGENGTANLGGGGGGCGPNSSNAGNGGGGGSGVVILKTPTSNYSGTTTGSPTVTTSGDYKVLTFNSSGSYTVS